LKARVFNILEESDLDELVTKVMEEPTSNAGRKAKPIRRGKPKPRGSLLTQLKIA
jgi:hypothetical protein